MPGPDLSHPEATGVGVGMEHAHEVRDSRTALYRIGILGLGIWSIVAFVGGPGESPVSAEEATSRIAAVCDDIDVAEAGSLLNMTSYQMSASGGGLSDIIDVAMDDLDRLQEIVEIAAESKLSWASYARTQLPYFEFTGELFRTISKGLQQGRALSDLAEEIRVLDVDQRVIRARFRELGDGLGSIDRCASVVTLLPSWN